VEKDIDGHIPLCMCSNIIDPDTVAFWYPEPYLYLQSGGPTRDPTWGILVTSTIHANFASYSTSFVLTILMRTLRTVFIYQASPIKTFSSVVRQVDIPGLKIYKSSNLKRTRQEIGSQAKECVGLHIAYFPWDATPFYVAFMNSGPAKKRGRSGAILVLPGGGSTSYIPNSFFHPAGGF